MTEPAILDRLSDAQRRALLAYPWIEDSPANVMAVTTLIYRGIMDWRREWWLFGPKVLVLTKLGKALRARPTSWPATRA